MSTRWNIINITKYFLFVNQRSTLKAPNDSLSDAHMNTRTQNKKKKKEREEKSKKRQTCPCIHILKKNSPLPWTRPKRVAYLISVISSCLVSLSHFVYFYLLFDTSFISFFFCFLCLRGRDTRVCYFFHNISDSFITPLNLWCIAP